MRITNASVRMVTRPASADPLGMMPLDLSSGELEIVGLVEDASNYTFLAELISGDSRQLVIYKPQRGEAPLWDFPRGTLCNREVAAYTLCGLIGWDFVPPTILRDGPHGLGAVQQYIDHDPSIVAFDVADSHRIELKRIALFDVIANNADRKAGHVLLDVDSKLWGVDHGICFHVAPKLRTVLWDFIGEPFEPDDLASVEKLSSCFEDEVAPALSHLIHPSEVDALRERITAVIEMGVYPAPRGGRAYPWPPV